MEIWMVSGSVSGVNWVHFGLMLAVAYLALALFGIGYDRYIARMYLRGSLEGFEVFYAAGWNALTLVIFLLPPSILSFIEEIALPVGLWGLATIGAFIVSGVPMLIGSLVRYQNARRHAIQSMIEETKMEGVEQKK